MTADTEPLRRLEASIQTVFFGKAGVVRKIVIGLLTEGHILIEDVPGVGKTTLARALARDAPHTALPRCHRPAHALS